MSSIKTKSQYFKLVKMGLMDVGHYNSYKNKLTKVIRVAKEAYFKNLFKTNRSNLKKVWSTLKDLLGKRNKHGGVKEVVVDGSVCSLDVDIANSFNKYFSSVGTNLDSQLPASNSHFSDFMCPISSHSFFIKPTSPDEISEIILSLKRKNSELNEIPVSILCKVRSILSIPLSNLINLSFKTGLFPEILKCANIVPIHKSGPLNEVLNYRPISILPTFSKIFEKCMSSRLIRFLSKFNIISSCQFGFMKGKNTTQAILNFTNKIYESFNSKLHTVGIF